MACNALERMPSRAWRAAGWTGLAYTPGYVPAPTPEPGEEVDEDMKRRAAQELAREAQALRVR